MNLEEIQAPFDGASSDASAPPKKTYFGAACKQGLVFYSSLAYVDSNFEFVPHDDTQLSAAVEKAKRGAASLTRPSRTQL